MVVKLLGTIIALLWSVSLAAQDKPVRILSVDYCADQFVLGLADRDQIIGVSLEATDAHSYYRERAKGLRKVRPVSDQILAMKPDLVVRSWAGDPKLMEMLERLDIPVLNISYIEDSADKERTVIGVTRTKVQNIADRLGHRARGEALLKELEARHDQLEAQAPLDLEALYMTPGAFSTGSGTFMHKIMKLAGLKNYMANRGYKGWAPIGLEHLADKKPDLIVTGFYDVKSATQSHWGITNHAFAKDMLERLPRADVPGSYVACDGLFTVLAAESIRAQAEEILQ